MDEQARIKDWVGYERDKNRDVFCAALTGILANRNFNVQLDATPREAVKMANRIALEFFSQENANR